MTDNELLDRVLHGESLVHTIAGQRSEPLPPDAGYFFAPEVPLTQTPVVLDPDSFNPRPGILTRYGRGLLEQGARFYSHITIDGTKVPLDEEVRLNWRECGF